MKQTIKPGDFVIAWDDDADAAVLDMFIYCKDSSEYLYKCVMAPWKNVRHATPKEIANNRIEVEVEDPPKPWAKLKPGDPCLARSRSAGRWEARVFCGEVDGKPATYAIHGPHTDWQSVTPFDPDKVGEVTE